MNGNVSACLPVVGRWRLLISTLGILALCSLSGTNAVRAVDEPAPPAPGQAVAPAPTAASPGCVALSSKLTTIRIPVIGFEDTSLEEAVDFLRLRTRELDTGELEPARKGLNFVVLPPAHPPAEAGASGYPRIKELKLRDVSLGEALHAICEATGMRCRVDDWAVTLLPAAQPEKAPAKLEIEDSPAALANLERLTLVFIPIIEFDDTSVEEAVDFFRLRRMGFEHDYGRPPEKPQNIALPPPPAAGGLLGNGEPAVPHIRELRLRNVPEIEALRYVCELTGLRCKVTAAGVVLVAKVAK